jgi:hypothetical protein
MIQDCGMPVLIMQVNRFPGSGAKRHRPPLWVPPLRVAGQFVPQARRPTGIEKDATENLARRRPWAMRGSEGAAR